jgi:hypothetical protein
MMKVRNRKKKERNRNEERENRNEEREEPKCRKAGREMKEGRNE